MGQPPQPIMVVFASIVLAASLVLGVGMVLIACAIDWGDGANWTPLTIILVYALAPVSMLAQKYCQGGGEESQKWKEFCEGFILFSLLGFQLVLYHVNAIHVEAAL